MHGREDADDGPRLLLVEEDSGLSVLLTGVLTDEQYAVTRALDTRQGLHFGLNRDWDVIVLDRDNTAVDGIDLMSRLRSRGVKTPALVLKARDGAQDELERLDSGINDYLAKPFDVAELVARLPRLLTRASERVVDLTAAERAQPSVVAEPTVVAEPAVLAEPAVVAEPVPADVRLSARESALLRTLTERPDHVFSRDELGAAVFGELQRPGSVDSCVRRVRRKLGPDVVHTVRGVGYRLGGG
jgi:two-component system response regulator QseB